MEIQTESKSFSAFLIYILGFLFVLHTTLPAYINSSFLSELFSNESIGIIYSIGSIATILSLAAIPSILRVFGIRRTITFFIFLELASILSISFIGSPIMIMLLFVFILVWMAIIAFIIDLFLENISSDSRTGRIRGTFLTSVNIAWVIAPLITSFILTDGDYWKIYIASAVILLPVFFITRHNLKYFKSAEYIKEPFMKVLKIIWKNRDIRNVSMASFLMQFFFAWMVIYMPLYLHNQVGLDWKQIGILFSVMLLPYIFIEFPLGKIADDKLGEKEIMSIGFIIMAISTGIISFISDNNFYVWMAILFITRIGASMVEIMSETYFFKKIDSSQIQVISVFRTTKPFAYAIAPLVATALFSVIELKYIFIFLGILMFFGLKFSLALKDTK